MQSMVRASRFEPVQVSDSEERQIGKMGRNQCSPQCRLQIEKRRFFRSGFQRLRQNISSDMLIDTGRNSGVRRAGRGPAAQGRRRAAAAGAVHVGAGRRGAGVRNAGRVVARRHAQRRARHLVRGHLQRRRQLHHTARPHHVRRVATGATPVPPHACTPCMRPAVANVSECVESEVISAAPSLATVPSDEKMHACVCLCCICAA